MADQTKKIPITVVGAYAKFEAARQAIQAFKHEHEDVFDDLENLVAAYNEAILEMKEQLREHEDVIGSKYKDFGLSPATNVDGNLLVSVMDEQDLIDAGIVKKETVYTVNRKAYDAAVAAKDIPQNVDDEVRTPGTTRIKGPKPFDVP